MPFLLALSLVIQVACIIHAIKTGRDRMWIWLILLFPGVGSAAYFFLEILPDLRQTRAGRAATVKVLKTIDPQRDLKRLAKELELTDNVENKVKLAEECVAHEMHAEAIRLYRSALTGIFENDPHILLRLAVALFGQGNYAETKVILERVIAENPDFKSQQGHLLFARTLEALHENDTALEEYAVLATYFSGYEAKCRYGLLLNKVGQTEKALKVFKEILTQAKNMPRNYRKAQSRWIDIAKQQLQQ